MSGGVAAARSAVMRASTACFCASSITFQNVTSSNVRPQPLHTASPSAVEQRATQAIEKTRAFFELMGVPTRFSAYGLDESVIPAVVAKLKQHGRLKLGEHGDITPDAVTELLRLAL